MTAATRKATERARKHAAGLKRLEIYAPLELHASIKAYVQRITARPPHP